MPCHTVALPDGNRAIVCGRGRPRSRCVSCGAPADRECDWKVPSRRSGTCDAPICARCTHEPAQDKDLCPNHAAEWQARLARRTA